MVDEALFIERSFRENFSVKDTLAIYGLGKNTRIVIEKCPEFNIVGLMDGARTGEEEWGLPIISVDEAKSKGVQKIIIIATSANVPIIYRRIEDACEQYGIDVFDISGNKKEPSGGEYKIDPFYSRCTEENLKKKIDDCDVISFDIFDTLLVRDVLHPTDIFERVGKRFTGSIPDRITFTEIRIKCERKLYFTGNPTIHEIYREIQNETGIDEKLAAQLMEAEVEEEFKSLSAREHMKELVKYALLKGKRVCCTSDMYLTRDIILKLLRNNQYEGFDNIFVSCEYGVSKRNGLFEILRAYYMGKSILHIGDNYDSDIIGARKSGIEETFQLSSVYQMISDSAVRKMLRHDVSLDDRFELGRLTGHLFKDPFLFAETKGKCTIKNNYELGYYFIEPLLTAYIEWMLEACKDEKIELLLLGARDGMIIQRMLDIRKKYKETDIQYLYLYVSRYACTLAGLLTEDDVRYAISMTFNGSVEEQLQKRFAFSKSELAPRMNGEGDEQFWERQIPLILKKSQVYRDKYRKYLKKLPLDVSRIGFFDFVSSGTCQLWLTNIWPEAKWTGYYFIKTLDKYKDKLDIKSYFKPKYIYEKQSKLYENYIFMENIMTSFEPTFRGFSDNGEIVFESETRSEKQLGDLTVIHDGIIAAYEDRFKRGQCSVSRDLADDILDIINDDYSVMEADFFEENILEDSFCNRKFDLKKATGVK